MTLNAAFAFDNTYAQLPERFYTRLSPTPVRAPGLIRVNHALAEQLGLDPRHLASDQGVAELAGNQVPEGADPIAMAYAGFQFGGWVPQLGDGRAILLGELIDADGIRHDVQLKGAGRTPYSRNGDGRAALGPVLREYVVSEAMAALGVPTTRALAAVTTGEAVMRERPLPGAILARVARSHIRVGTFQFFAARGDLEALQTLADYAIERHYPEAQDSAKPVEDLLRRVVDQQADLVARWMLLGFIHGVMNTDNTSIAAETIDYGPCAFVDVYHPDTVFSSIDHAGRYAYRNQPSIMHWNLAGFAQTLLPLLDADPDKALASAQALIDAFPTRYGESYNAGARRKLGLIEARDEDSTLMSDLLSTMAEEGADFTLTFRYLSDLSGADASNDNAVRSLFNAPEAFDRWAARWRARLVAEGSEDLPRIARMRETNPAYIPRNHRVEAVIRAAEDEGDLVPFDRLLKVLSVPYDDQPEHAEYRSPPRPEEVVHQTFCGT